MLAVRTMARRLVGRSPNEVLAGGMAAMTDTFTVMAKRWDKGWELHIDGIGVTQARKLSEAELMVRDLIKRRESAAGDDIELEWRFNLGAELDAAITAARSSPSTTTGSAPASRSCPVLAVDLVVAVT